MTGKTFDVRCFELAEAFLEDEVLLRGLAAELAAHIQEAIEDWIEAAKQEVAGDGTDAA